MHSTLSASISIATTPPPPVKVEPVPSVASPPHEDIHQYGFSAGDLVDLSRRDLDATLDAYTDLGIKWVRVDIPWSVVQRTSAADYEWSSYDRVVEAAARHRLKVLMILDYTPQWARPAECTEDYACAPLTPNQFAYFAGTAVKRYKPKGVTHWEVWNEPNHVPFWRPAPNVAGYTALLKAVYTSIKREDPAAFVITGGLSPAFTGGGEIAPAEFLSGIYANGGKGYFDAIGHHPYSYPALPTWNEGWTGWMQMQEMRAVMVAQGDTAKQIWLTEYGAPTNGPGPLATLSNFNFANAPDHVDEALQAEMVRQSVAMYRTYDWVGPLFWYQYRDRGTAPDSNENFFGLVRADGSRKPAYDVMRGLLRN